MEMSVMISALTPADWVSAVSALGGAVLGAVIGGIISFLLASRASKETLRRDREARIDREKSLAMQVTLKISELMNDFATMKKHWDEMESLAVESGGENLESWQKFQPLVGSKMDGIDFTYEELSVFIAAKDFETLHEVDLLAKQHYSIIKAVHLYGERRLALTDQFPAEMKGRIGITPLTREQHQRFAPRMVELNGLIDDMRQRVGDEYNKAHGLADRVGDVFRKHFSDPSFPKIGVATPKQ